MYITEQGTRNKTKTTLKHTNINIIIRRSQYMHGCTLYTYRKNIKKKIKMQNKRTPENNAA